MNRKTKDRQTGEIFRKRSNKEKKENRGIERGKERKQDR